MSSNGSEVLEEELHIALVDWIERHQQPSHPEILLPPQNVVTGNRSMDTSLRLNEAAGEAFPPGEGRVVPAFYLILHPKVFKSENFVERLCGDISNALTVHRIVAFKLLFNATGIWSSATRRSQLLRLLTHIDELKKQSEDSFLAIAIDIGEPGLAMMANGIDVYVEPLSGFIWFPQARRGSKADKIAEEEDLDLGPKEEYWLHPIIRTELPMTAEVVREPCDCPVHTKALNASEGEVGTLVRKIHHYNARSREIDLMVEAVGNQDLEFFQRVLKGGQNQNLLSLLPSSSDERMVAIKR